MEKRKIYCCFYDCDWMAIGKFYTCRIEREIIPSDTEFEITGLYYLKSFQDVEAINLIKCTMPIIPQNFVKFFPKLKVFQIVDSKLKSIERKDLQQFDELKYVNCPFNEIEYLPGDLFDDHKNLEGFSFRNNKIKIIEPHLFDRMEMLKSVNLIGNPCINKSWDSSDHSGITTLQQIKIKVQLNYSPLEVNKMRQKYEDLKKACSICMNENGLYSDLKDIIQNEKLKDFVVTVNDEEFKVHKLVLAARSPVLKEMIENNIDADSLNLIDISKDIFREILNFIYTDEQPQSNDINFIRLYAASERLKIENLKKFAAEKLMNKINDENALEVLTLANKYENEILKQKSFEKIKKQFRDDTAEINYELASNPEKLKKIIDMKKKKNEMMKQMNLELAKLMRGN